MLLRCVLSSASACIPGSAPAANPNLDTSPLHRVQASATPKFVEPCPTRSVDGAGLLVGFLLSMA